MKKRFSFNGKKIVMVAAAASLVLAPPACINHDNHRQIDRLHSHGKNQSHDGGAQDKGGRKNYARFL